MLQRLFGQNFRVQQGNGDGDGDDGGLHRYGENDGPAVTRAQKRRGFNQRFLEHDGTSMRTRCAFRRGMRTAELDTAHSCVVPAKISCEPQGLKPHIVVGELNGTAEAVPLRFVLAGMESNELQPENMASGADSGR